MEMTFPLNNSDQKAVSVEEPKGLGINVLVLTLGLAESLINNGDLPETSALK